MQPAAEFYSVLAIQPEWVLEDEAMGSKQKFWFRQPADGTDWLFKFPKPNTGQHWAEKIAAEIAEELEILHARVDLAVFDGVQGSATESFARDGRELYHGNQVLAGQVLGYDPAKRFGQSSHTLTNLFLALDRVFQRLETATTAKMRIADYLVLDALIGNTDRHHENWGILTKKTAGGRSEMIAPSFDHASSLGHGLVDDSQGKCRRRILEQNRIALYAESASGAIYWDGADKRGVSPLEMVRRAARAHPDLFRRSFALLDKLERESLERIVRLVPAGWMSDVARQFAIELTCYNLKELKKIAL
jgi:hypothetical protein